MKYNKSLAVLNECGFNQAQKNHIKGHFKEAVFYSDTHTIESAIKRIGRSNIVVLDQFVLPFSEEILKNCPNIELIIVNTTAYDRVDLEMLKRYGVRLANMRDYATTDVAETALGMMLSLNNRLQLAQEAVLKHNVADIYPGHPIADKVMRRSLKSQTVGILGLGNIGRTIAEACLGLGMRVVGFNHTRTYGGQIEIFPLSRVLAISDIAIVAIKYDPSLKNYIGKNELKLMKDGSMLISIADSNLIDFKELIKIEKKFSGLGFDGFVTDGVSALLRKRKENIIVTPHLGSQSADSMANMTYSIIDAAESFAKGRPLYLVN